MILSIFVYMMIRARYNRRRNLLERQHVSEDRELVIEHSFLGKVAGVPTIFKYKELEKATDNFQALLGQGASGSVFKGILDNGTCVAVKQIKEERGEDFISEVAAIGNVQHINLVHLLGVCIVPGGPRFLVYEFIPNGSLDCWIFPGRRTPDRFGGCLPWELRYRVAIDVAKALSYLHHDCRNRILHLDLKPENIVLDENFRAIVIDFGLSKLMGKDESRVVTTIRGTRGYLAPEWLLGHGISEKCDVYSYGMVLLEIIGGKKNVSLVQKRDERSTMKWEYFPKIVHQRMKEKRLMEVIDQRLLMNGDSIDKNEVVRLANVAFWCVQERASLRPTMAHVVEMLEGHVPVEEPPNTHMIMVDLLSNDEDLSAKKSSASPDASSNVPDKMSHSFDISLLSGR